MLLWLKLKSPRGRGIERPLEQFLRYHGGGDKFKITELLLRPLVAHL